MGVSHIDHNKHYHTYDAVKRIIDDGKKRGLWIYDPVSKNWYTPEEMELLFTKIMAKNIRNVSQYQLLSPVDAILKARTKIAHLQDRLDRFIRIVVEKSTGKYNVPG